jgi:2-polyprenyl-6-methoxyphenol hydroxylase-like FAD-dependent oxidoreductase
MPAYRVGVVGYGMIGSVVSYLLARDGHSVSLFERSPVVSAVGAGILLQPSGQQVLQHLGILDQVVAHSAPLTELHAVHADGRTLIRNRYTDFDPDMRAYGTHRGVLFAAAKSLVETQPVDVHLGTDIVRRSVENGKVWLVAADGERFGPFDFVVCGDGSRSVLRTALGKRWWRHDYRHGAIWAIAPSQPVRGKLLQVVDRNRRLCGVLPLGDGLTTLYWGASVGEYDTIRRRGIDALKREIVTFCPETADLLDFVYDMDQLIFTTYRAVWMARRFDRHSIFLGDSSHAMSPHLGQGINIAMLDAWILAACVRQTHTPLEAFRLWHRRQADYLRYYAAVTFFLSPFFQSDVTFLGWGRDVVLPWLPHVPFVKKQMLMTMAGLKGGFFRGRRDVV